MTIRFTILFFIAMFCAMPVFAQQKTLLGNGNDHFGGYGAAGVRLTQVDGKFAVMPGGYGAFLMNHQFAMGIGGFGLANEVEYARNILRNAEGEIIYQNYRFYYMGYGGGYVELILVPQEPIHVTVNALVGVGAIGTWRRYSQWSIWDEYDDNIDAGPADLFFVFEPGLNVELNMTQWFRIGLGASYRYIDGINRVEGKSDQDFRAFSGNVDFKFGGF